MTRFHCAVVGVGVVPVFGNTGFGDRPAFTPDGLAAGALGPGAPEAALQPRGRAPRSNSSLSRIPTRYEVAAMALPHEVQNLDQLRGLLVGLEMFLVVFA